MRLLFSMAVAALAATAICSPSPASAQACVQDVYGRVVCGLAVAPYPGGPYYDPYDPGLIWPIGFCPGGVAGNYECIPWRKPRGSKCLAPNRTVKDGACRLYSDKY